MRVSGFSMVRDAVRLHYPVAESIRSILPICDEFVIAVGPGRGRHGRADPRHRRSEGPDPARPNGIRRTSCTGRSTPSRAIWLSTSAPATGPSTSRPTRWCTKTTFRSSCRAMEQHLGRSPGRGAALPLSPLLGRLRPLPLGAQLVPPRGARGAERSRDALVEERAGIPHRRAQAAGGRQRRADLPLRVGAPAGDDEAEADRPRPAPPSRRLGEAPPPPARGGVRLRSARPPAPLRRDASRRHAGVDRGRRPGMRPTTGARERCTSTTGARCAPSPGSKTTCCVTASASIETTSGSTESGPARSDRTPAAPGHAADPGEARRGRTAARRSPAAR